MAAPGELPRTKEARDIPPGSVITCTTKFDERLEGEVVAFDYASKFIVIKNQTDAKGGKKGNQDIRMLNMNFLQSFDIKEMATNPPPPLPALDLEKIERRIKENKTEKKQAINRVGIDVTPEGQSVFDTISKTFNELHWRDKDIIVMDRVTIVPPYKVDNIVGKDERSLTYIKEIVKKHWDRNEVESQQTPAPTK